MITIRQTCPINRRCCYTTPRSTMRMCRRLERRWWSSGLTIDRELYVDQCKMVNELLHQSKMRYIPQDNQSDQKRLFGVWLLIYRLCSHACELHWLHVGQGVEFKILLYTYKVVNVMAPVYLQELLDLYRPGRSLRSGTMRLLKTYSYNLKTYGGRALPVYAPQLWNALPLKLRECDSLGSFKKALETFLFKKHIVNITLNNLCF